ncbi:hypothetical protein CJ030_MR7G027509 [Morella rubra]|uniref:Uncharacterized protein n=1 Tax=Morella rubra TaxID=262757 RepID=A0A6A1UZ05_9ROSI|nr:hypothetical protein CJ030_MR7G027509 [Morella rubra]
MRHRAITCKNQILINNFFHVFYGEMKRGREFPSITSGQLHSLSSIPSPKPSAPSPRVNESMSQGTPTCPSSCALTLASKRGRGRTRGVSLEKSLGSLSSLGNYQCISRRESVEECLPLLPPIDEDWNDHFDLDYDVRTMVKTMMTARRTHCNQMHAYFKKFPSKKAALLKPHPDTTEEQWKSYAICSPAKHLWYERMDAFQRQFDLEGKTYIEIEVYSEILGKKSGYVRGLGRAVKPRLHQL